MGQQSVAMRVLAFVVRGCQYQNQDAGKDGDSGSDDGNQTEGEAYSESAYRRLTKEARDGLVKKTITDKNGDKQTVWVRGNADVSNSKWKPGQHWAPTVAISGNPTAEHYAIAKRYLEITVGVDERQKGEYEEDMAHSLSTLPRPVFDLAMQSIGLSGDKGMVFYGTLKLLRQESGSKDSIGFHREHGDASEIHIDGDKDSRGTYVHELWHAADNQTRFSLDKQWVTAWKSEILHAGKGGSPTLGTQAKVNPTEGMAEFGRILSGKGIEYMNTSFPKCVLACQKMGLL